jgi:hypothetical protein
LVVSYGTYRKQQTILLFYSKYLIEDTVSKNEQNLDPKHTDYCLLTEHACFFIYTFNKVVDKVRIAPINDIMLISTQRRKIQIFQGDQIC